VQDRGCINICSPACPLIFVSTLLNNGSSKTIIYIFIIATILVNERRSAAAGCAAGLVACNAGCHSGYWACFGIGGSVSRE
jgi:hypothetical protein